MRKKPATNADLLEAGVDEPRIASAWLKAKVKVEEARSSRATCRICGKRIKKGEKVVVSDSFSLRSLYGGFWSRRLYAHLECYERMTMVRGLEETSPYRRRRYCPVCGKWYEIFNGEEDTWPKKLDNAARCPFCHSLLRLKPRKLPNAPRISADLGDLKVVPATGRQLSLDDFLFRKLVWVRKRDGNFELYKIE